MGSDDKGGVDGFRRITRIWRSRDRIHRLCELSPGCRLTVDHPVWWSEQWRKPKTIVRPVEHDATTGGGVVYNLEVEGHVDTVLVGGLLCSTLGLYCGEDFGWNVFTRKTRPCDTQPCAKCARVVIPDLDFSRLSNADLKREFAPY